MRVYKNIRDTVTGWFLPHGVDHDPKRTTVETNPGWRQKLERSAQECENEAARADTAKESAVWIKAAAKFREVARKR